MDAEAWNCPIKGALLTSAVLADSAFLHVYEQLVLQVVLPWMKGRLAVADPARFGQGDTQMWYQYPPTLRLQPGSRCHAYFMFRNRFAKECAVD